MRSPQPVITAIAACLVAVAALGAGTAHADVIVKGTGEPAFTNSANNTQWVEWSNNGNYRIEFHHYVNGTKVHTVGPFQVPQVGSSWVNWSGVPGTAIPLQEGSTYGICGFGRWDDGTGMYWPDFSTSCNDGDRRGLRTSTTIDRTAPAVAVKVAGGLAVTKTAALPVHMDFTDNLAGPFPANFVCVQYGDTSGGMCDSNQGYQYVQQPACSQPATGGASTGFDCTIDVGPASTNPAPDGPVTICAIATDASIPDNPTSADQRAPATSANRSAPPCGSVLLDRTPPTMAIVATPATGIDAGEVVWFDPRGSDRLAGVRDSYVWNWGDGSKTGGRAVTHAFANPGTFTVTLTVTDRAGNKTVVRKAITVGSGTPTPPPATAPETNTLTASAPASVTVPSTGAGTVDVTMNASSAGRVSITLLRGTTPVAVGGRPIPAGTTKYALRLPVNAIPGAHVLKVAYTPTGRTTIAKSVRVTLADEAAPGFAAGRASASEPTLVGDGEGGALPDGRYRGPSGTRVAAAPTR